MNQKNNIPFANKEELERLKARYNHLDFYKYFWKTQTQDKLYIGLHTKYICQEIDRAIENLKKGESTYLLITVPPRHGKSDMVSRYLPAHFMGLFPDKDVILATYSSSLAFDLSKDARKIVRTPEYKEIFGKELAKDSSAVDSWKMNNGKGTVTASGLLSGITGKGGNLLILDDYCASRESAESEVMREKTWNSFTNDFMTRRSPTSIVIVLATQWHVDDVIGRIKQKNDLTNDNYDAEFPKFKILSFPAENGDFDIEEKDGSISHVKYDYLFIDQEINGKHYEGRFQSKYYDQSRAILGDYSYQALYLCDPTTRGGNLLKLDKIKFHDTLDDFPKVKFGRFWDLAHTAKQTQKSDPDWTSGTLLTYTKNKDGLWELWIKDVQHYRLSSPERDNMIRATTDKDGMSVPVVVEESLDAKDTVYALQTALMGRRKVQGIKIKHGDKVSRMSYVEPIFEAGSVHILRAGWNLDWLNEARSFPSGKHDDMMDNITAGYEFFCEGNGQIVVGGVLGF